MPALALYKSIVSARVVRNQWVKYLSKTSYFAETEKKRFSFPFQKIVSFKSEKPLLRLNLTHEIFPDFCSSTLYHVGCTFANIPYQEPILIATICCIFLEQILWKYSVATNVFEGELQIRKQRKNISMSTLLLACVWVVVAFVWKKNQDVYLAAFFWALALADVITYFIYKQKKPVSLVIHGKKLLINDLWLIERDLNELTSINLNEVKKSLELFFANKPKSKLTISEYDEVDIILFVEYVTVHSGHAVELSENLKDAITPSK